MCETNTTACEEAKQPQKSLARWDSEGGAGPDGPQKQHVSGDVTDVGFSAAEAELAQLHTRIIALESLMIALLAEASDGQRTAARDMAATISPRPGSIQHPLTIYAARQMLNMIERAEHFTLTTTP